MNRNIIKLMGLAIMVIALISCGGASFSGGYGAGDNQSGAVAGGEGEEEVDSSEGGELPAAFPADLAISSPFVASSDSSSSVSQSVAAKNVKTIKSYTERKKEIGYMLSGTKKADCAVNVDIFKLPPPVNCYGPRVKFQNHPDGAAFGSELPIGDTGIWAENNFTSEGDTGEACAAAKLNSLVADAAAKVDTAIDFFAGMFCMAKVEGRDELPDAGESIDLRTSLEGAASSASVAVSDARVERLEDSADSRPVYRSSITADTLDGGKPAALDIKLRHIPLNDDNTKYTGRLWYTIKDKNGRLMGGTPNCGFKKVEQIAYSIIYSKGSDGKLKYSIRSASYCSADANPFDEENNVDTKMKKWSGNFNIGTYVVDTADGTGTYSHAWQAGPGDGHTRTIVAEIAEDRDDISGCAYFGYGPEVRDEAVGSIDGFICNWAGPGSEPFGMKRVLPLVQRQCMTLDRQSGKFVSDSRFLNIKYAPTNSCDVADAFPDADFVFHATPLIPEDILSNDKNEPGEYTNELLDISDMDIIPPEPLE